MCELGKSALFKPYGRQEEWAKGCASVTHSDPQTGRQIACQGKHLGVPILCCLAEEWTVPILRELDAGPLRPSELDERLPRAPHAAVMRRLRQLHSGGVVLRQRSRGLSPRADYFLTDAGRELMEIPRAADRWARHASPPDSGRRPAGRLALRLTADEMTRTILLSLADGPLRPLELEKRLPQVGRSAVRDKLGRLVIAGILTRSTLGGYPNYSLTPSARRLSLLGLLAGYWEWRWTTGVEAHDGSELAGLLRLLAPVVRTPEPLAGVCRLRVASDPRDRDVYLVADHGRLAAVHAASGPVEAVGYAAPEVWCDALLHMQLAGITKTGDATFMVAVLASVSSALTS